MLSFIENHKTQINQLCEKFDVKTMHIFGSAITSEFNEFSDIDILISFKQIPIEKYTDNYFDLHEKLEKLFERKVDLLTDRSLSNPYFIESVEKTKHLLYAA
ncbi:nucleotidyltransferase domain protein [Pedobacter glucosidilyticus]|uniref:Nucleotidyltransferase domain-containing protein n=1 Tax=Pedobacter aquae TaxID=2605747 RepID=A0A5C0VH92_9SPHI|nr:MULTISPECIES: nucleotidyltransferase domain-containing protein [Pedobacter]KHJ38110.1 nucleotidyltransferase domain protein [Pedobacter glucosidilyticus]QEK51292.1 nucleotidyltransferase domain-containing protein [Pedobacter aquae]